ncbi:MULTISPECIES: hypothetical protein [unclassified Novosphingobium]|uniref:hypothetical protein n=1 Tax=unclassified Novosphingobium TaxID=2644732 RepID=UPI001359E34D|nr:MULTISPECIES: hypothetical protein [unclassified Novosphingobium]
MTAEATSKQPVNFHTATALQKPEHPAIRSGGPRASAREAMERAIFLARKLHHRVVGSASGNEKKTSAVDEHLPDCQGSIIAVK